jgi:hypothetical protein
MENKEILDKISISGYITRIACCGIAELHSIKGLVEAFGPDGVAFKVGSLFATGSFNGTFLVFSEVKGNGGYGEKLRDFVLSANLGGVTQTTTLKNPNSGNYLTAYIWEVDRSNLKIWYDKQEEIFAKACPKVEPTVSFEDRYR